MIFSNNYTARFTRGNILLYSLSAVAVLIVFHIVFGLEVLVPTNINWLLSARHDWGQHYLGWAFYRNEPWTFPLGQVNDVLYPAGSNVGYWDGIPLLALFFKLFSAILPDDFQYLGAWLLFCYLMAAWYTIKIFRLYTTNTFYILIGVLFVACNPVLVYRGLHPALCAHGFIIAAIYYYLSPATAANVRSLNKRQVLLAIISALINPYICMMVLGFSFILPFRHYFYDKLLSLKSALAYIGLTLAGIFLAWLAFGLITLGDSSQLQAGNSYGILSFNLNSLFNSSGFSTWLPQMPWLNPGQYEGFMYLGVGMMILIVLAFFLLLLREASGLRKRRHLIPLAVLVLLFTAFAISNRVTYNDQLLFEIPIPGIVNKIGGIFRACGRFLWPVYYLLFFFALIIFIKSRLPQWAKAAVLTVLVAVQFYDCRPIYIFRNLPYGAYDTPLNEAKWNAVLPQFKRMITYPPFEAHLLNSMDYQDLSFLALKNNKAISTGYSAREDRVAYQAYTDSLTLAMDNDELRADELYITTPQHINAFGTVLHTGKFNVAYLDGYYLLYAKSQKVDSNALDTPEALKKTDSLKAAYKHTKFARIIAKPAFTNDKIKFNIENIAVNNNNIRLKGWAFLEGKTNNKGDSVFVTLSGPDKMYVARASQFARPDLTAAYKAENLESSGFSASIFTDDLEPFNYTLGIAIASGNGWTYAQLGTLSDLKTTEKPFKIAKVSPQAGQAGNIDGFETGDREITVNGWSAFTDADAIDNEILVLFVKPGQSYAVRTKSVMRPDVTESYKNKYKYDTSGFSVKVEKKTLPKGTYKTGILVRNVKTGRESAMITDKQVEIK